MIALATYTLLQTEYLWAISLHFRNKVSKFFLFKAHEMSSTKSVKPWSEYWKCWDFFSELLFDVKRAGVKLGWNKSSTIWKKHDPLFIHTFNLSFHILQSSISHRLKNCPSHWNVNRIVISHISEIPKIMQNPFI